MIVHRNGLMELTCLNKLIMGVDYCKSLAAVSSVGNGLSGRASLLNLHSNFRAASPR